MSSVTRFIRQLPVGLQYASLPTSAANLFELVLPSSNVVGNYPGGVPPGGMVASTNAPALAAYLNVDGGPYTGGAPNPNFVMRDMGKTVLAVTYDTEENALSGTVNVNTVAARHFRQFQILNPLASNPGGAFGVSGGPTIPNSYTDYVTVYIPVTVLGNAVAPLGVSVVPGGQM